MAEKKISKKVIMRLPQYLRVLEEFLEKQIKVVSSKNIANRLHATSSQVRQDLCCFGDFGNQGLGYNVEKLILAIRNILGLTKSYQLIVVGAGNIGTALSGYQGFKQEGFFIKAMFDVKDEKLNENAEIPIYPSEMLDKYLNQNAIDIAIICTGKSVAQQVADKLVSLGIRNIWNFAPVDLTVPKNVWVEDVQLSASLYMLAYNIKNIK